MTTRNVQDQLDKGLLQNWLPPAGHTLIDFPVVGQKQEADVWFEPDATRVAERRRLGTLGRMVGRGPCLLEPFSRAPGVFAVEDCVRKQLVLEHRPVCLTERNRGVASSARRDEGAG